MTEIEFLAKLLLDIYASDDLRKKIVDRIIEVEQLRAVTQIPSPGITYHYIYQQAPQYPHVITSQWGSTCQHEYPGAWGGTGSPSCIKCGQPMSTSGGAGGCAPYGGGAGGLCTNISGGQGGGGSAGGTYLALLGGSRG